ncbi:MAG: TIGR04002 family protein [Lachnospiraceae bacterium]|nr:TIGR04002 family protein [Lachnospiraceae bacterium]
MKHEKHEKIRYMCLTGVFTAVVFVFTAYLHIPSHTGYTHVGDGFIYLAACMLPLPYAAVVGAVGALLADCLTGFAMWAPGSVVIKTVTVLFFTAKGKKMVSGRNLLALIPAAAVCIGGYYLYEAVLTGNFAAPLAGIPGYVTQSLLSSILFVCLGTALDKLKVREHIINGGKRL